MASWLLGQCEVIILVHTLLASWASGAVALGAALERGMRDQ
jgi:hypothetical protein